MNTDFMTQTFGASGINREMFNDCFDEPIDMSNVSDDMMQELADDVEAYMRNRFPEDEVDDMFKIWVNDDPTDDELDTLAVTYKEAWDTYWDILGKFAITAGGKVTACDLDEDE